MKLTHKVVWLAAAGMVVAAGGTTYAESITAAFARPTFDRWWYPFNFQAGGESSSPTFGAIETAGFDDRDAQFVVGWNTTPSVPSGFAPERYKVRSLRVRAAVSVDNQARYDETPISYRNLLQTTNPEYVADTTPGSPVELFGAGYRNGVTAATLAENTAFGVGQQPAEGTRSVFAIDTANGQDISRQVRQHFNAAPLAIGRTTSVTPGALMPQGTVLTFDVDLCVPGALAYVQQSLAAGRLVMVISSLEPAQGGPGGGTGGAYPAFYTKESPTATQLGLETKLDIVVDVGSLADLNNDDGVTIDDLVQFLQWFEGGDPRGDLSGDCGVTVDDLVAFLVAFEQG